MVPISRGYLPSLRRGLPNQVEKLVKTHKNTNMKNHTDITDKQTKSTNSKNTETKKLKKHTNLRNKILTNLAFLLDLMLNLIAQPLLLLIFCVPTLISGKPYKWLKKCAKIPNRPNLNYLYEYDENILRKYLQWIKFTGPEHMGGLDIEELCYIHRICDYDFCVFDDEKRFENNKEKVNSSQDIGEILSNLWENLKGSYNRLLAVFSAFFHLFSILELAVILCIVFFIVKRYRKKKDIQKSRKLNRRMTV